MAQRSLVPWRVAAYRGLLLLLVGLGMGTSSSAQRPAVPATLETTSTAPAHSLAEERQQPLAGQPITKLLDANASKELAVLGATWIEAPMRRYVEAIKDIEAFESGGGSR
jgi:hypothetical protein